MNESYSFYTDKLTGEYRKAFSKIELYISTKYIDEMSKEEYLGELLDIFLTAQSEGKPIQKIIGNNLERFCKTFCSGYGIKNRVFEFLDFLKSIVWSILVLSLTDMLCDYADGIRIDFWHSNSSVNIPLYLIGLFTVLLIGYASNLITRNIMFRTKHISMTVLKTVDCLIILGAAVLIFIAIININDNFLNFPVWGLVLTSTVYLVPYYIFNYKRLKENKRRKVRFKDMVAGKSEQNFSINMEKIFEKANRKNIKKGKGELSIEEFLQKAEKDCRKMKSTWGYYLFPPVITALMFIIEYIFGDFETVTDAVAFVVVMLFIEYAIVLGWIKIQKSSASQYMNWIKTKREESKKDNDE